MTPEEKAVVQAAIAWRNTLLPDNQGHARDFAQEELERATEALIFSRRGSLTTLSHPCIECMTDPTEDPRAWCDCGGRHEDGMCKAPCVQRAHAPERCPNRPCSCSRTEKVYCYADCQGGADVTALESIEPVEPAPEWVTAEWLHVLPGDHVRLNGQEADVATLRVGDWHADITSRLMDSGRWWDEITAWDHKELHIELKHLPGQSLPFPPSAPVEILMDRTRQAQYLLQTAFPGSRAA